MEQRICLVAVLLTFIIALHTCGAQEAYQLKALTLHNRYRQRHHAPALQMDNQLNSLAVKCADYYARKKRIDHSCPHANGLGENLNSGGGGNWSNNEFAEMSSQVWYDEVKNYNYNNPGFDHGTGHFTQVVWKNSKKFGFGFARVNGYTVGVGLYSPSGNFLGQFKENVLKP